MITTTIVPRSVAVAAIVDAFADRTGFVILVPPDHIAEIAGPLTRIRRFVGYIDNGTEAVLRTETAAVFRVCDVLSPTVAVVVVPKTVSARRLGHVLGSKVAEDGSQDLIALGPKSGGYCWPQLFVDALDRVDPRAADAIRAAAVQ